MKVSNVSRNIPLAEITLRKYEKPYEMPKRELVKKLCLSIGLLQPGDSRDVVVDVFCVLLDNKEVNGNAIVDKVIEYRKKNNLDLKGVAGSNIRRQLKRLKDLFLIERKENGYRISENENLSNLFEEKIEKFYLKSIVSRVKEYLVSLDNLKKWYFYFFSMEIREYIVDIVNNRYEQRSGDKPYDMDLHSLVGDVAVEYGIEIADCIKVVDELERSKRLSIIGGKVLPGENGIRNSRG